jgi:hypothetical protein
VGEEKTSFLNFGMGLEPVFFFAFLLLAVIGDGLFGSFSLYKYALFLYKYAFYSIKFPFSYNIAVKNAKFLAFFGIISE